MRISDAATYDQNLGQLTRARSELAKRQEQATSGRRVLKPSDDPMAMALARRERSREARAHAHQRAIDTGQANNEASDGALDQVGSILTRVKELTIEAATDTVDAAARADIGLEVRALRDQVHALANSDVGGRYLFGGFADGTAPFDAAGAYVGDARVRQVEVAPGVRLDQGVTDTTAFGSGATSVFTSLDNLATALAADNVATIRTSIDTVGAALNQVNDARAQLGANVDTLVMARNVAQRVEDRSAIDQTTLVGVQQDEAYLDFSRAQLALQAAVQIAGQLPYAGLVQRG